MKYIDFNVKSGGATCGIECGTVDFTFDDVDISFDVLQPSNGDWFTELCGNNIEIADKLNILYDKKYKITDVELIELIFDAYAILEITKYNIQFFNECNPLYKNMKCELNDVSPNGIIELGWIRIEIDGEHIQFDIRSDNFGELINNVSFTTDKDEEICNELGIQLDDDFKYQLMTAYGDL